jgi:hypothetical protein
MSIELAHFERLRKSQNCSGPALLLMARVTGQPAPVTLKCEVQLGEHLLGDLSRQITQPFDLSSQPCELEALANSPDSILVSPPAILIQADVPQVPRAP